MSNSPREEKEVKEEVDSSTLNEEQDQTAAFDPETGEINWDCPCLGGMAKGTCGEEFKEAFSCFVKSSEEPKGIECVERFKAMQDCFRQNPEEYSDMLDEDEDEDDSKEQEENETASKAPNAE